MRRQLEVEEDDAVNDDFLQESGTMLGTDGDDDEFGFMDPAHVNMFPSERMFGRN